MYVFPCVVLFLCFSVLLVLQLPRFGSGGWGGGGGERGGEGVGGGLVLVLFVRLFGLCCLGLSVSSSSWGLGGAAVCDCGTPWNFLLPFFSNGFND